MGKHITVDEPVLLESVPTQTIVNTSLEVPLRPMEIYTILDELENGVANDPESLLYLMLYLRSTLRYAGLPDTREEFEDEYYLPHPENEQYRRVTMWLDADKEDK